MTCPLCQEPAAPEQRFCEACGAPLSSAARTAPEAPPAAPEAVSGCQCPPGQGKPDDAGYCEICGMRMRLPGTATPAARAEGFEQIVDDRLALVSHPGRKHPLNEDAAWVERLADGRVLMIVADGVSSSWNAKQAAAIAVREARQVLSELGGATPPSEALHRALESAHQAVQSMPDHPAGSVYDEPASTIVAVLVVGGTWVIGWVGDSRAYSIPEGSGPETALTTDDSWVNLMVSGGQMTLEEAYADKQARFVTQTLGMRDMPPEIHVRVEPLPPGRHLLLCSDGLWNYFMTTGSLSAAVQAAGSAADAVTLCRTLVASANEKGGKDNVTAALLLRGGSF